MGKLKIIEMPREEIRLGILEQAMIEAGSNCETLRVCTDGKTSTCKPYDSSQCASGGCGGEFFASHYLVLVTTSFDLSNFSVL